MARPKVDIVIEAAHYLSSGEVGWVRVYERRGATFSDRLLLKRSELIARLRDGKKVYMGQRQEYLASTFNISHRIRLVKTDGREVLQSGEVSSEQDCLSGVPVI
jgi:hypothetical protein